MHEAGPVKLKKESAPDISLSPEGREKDDVSIFIERIVETQREKGGTVRGQFNNYEIVCTPEDAAGEDPVGKIGRRYMSELPQGKNSLQETADGFFLPNEGGEEDRDYIVRIVAAQREKGGTISGRFNAFDIICTPEDTRGSDADAVEKIYLRYTAERDKEEAKELEKDRARLGMPATATPEEIGAELLRRQAAKEQ
jgi:energy-converting hydrogenase Eha subunit B